MVPHREPYDRLESIAFVVMGRKESFTTIAQFMTPSQLRIEQ